MLTNQTQTSLTLCTHPRVQAVGRFPQVLKGALHEFKRVAVHTRTACGDRDQHHVRVGHTKPQPGPSRAPSGVPVPVTSPPVPTHEVTAQETKTPPARPLLGHLLCAGTALPAAGSARAPSSAKLSSNSSSSSKVGGDSKDLDAGAMAEGARGRPAVSRAVSDAAHQAGPEPVPWRRRRPRPPPARDPQPNPTHASRELGSA